MLLNSDTLLFKSSLEDLLRTAVDKDYQIVGPVLLNMDHSIQRSWFNFPSLVKIFLRLTDIYLILYKISNSAFFESISFKSKPAFLIKSIDEDVKMDYLTFACILIKAEVIQKIGNLDEGLFFYQEDCEYGLRAKKNGYDFVYCVSAKVVHLGGTSSSKFSWLAFENDILGLMYIYKKHYSFGKFKQAKSTIYWALTWRIVFSKVGFYQRIKKSGLYVKSNASPMDRSEMINGYRKVRDLVKNYQ